MLHLGTLHAVGAVVDRTQGQVPGGRVQQFAIGRRATEDHRGIDADAT